MTNSYDEIISRFLEAPDEAYGTAVKDQDFVALAVAGILDPEIGGPRAAKRFDALSKARGPDDVIAELVLGILEHADRISDELIDRARERRLQEIVASLADTGHTPWLSETLLPDLLRVRGRDLAQTVGDGWWPDECLPVFAGFAWHGIDEKLYVAVEFLDR